MGRIKKPCPQPGCGELVESGRCPAHQAQPEQAETRRRFDAWRGSARQRGYDARWERFRAYFIARHPACHDCERLATEVHHIQRLAARPDLKLVESNCMALCKRCHSTRTAKGE